MHISEMPPNQPDYPWFSKCTLNLGLEKPMLINFVVMSHLPLFSHYSTIVKIANCGKPGQILTLF